MKRFFIPLRSMAIIVSLSLSIASCGVSNTKPNFNSGKTPIGPTGAPGGTAPSTNAPVRSCGANMDAKGYKPVWSYNHCEAADTIRVDPNTTDANGVALGSRSVNRGRLMFKITGMSNNGISARETFGIIFMANGNGGGEANWQWMSYHVGGADIQSRIIVQRFDGTCPGFCEHSFITDEIQFRDPADVYLFDCMWDGASGKITCDITNSGAPGVKVHAENDTQGFYNSLRYIGVGAAAFDGPYPGYNGTVSEFMLAIFE